MNTASRASCTMATTAATADTTSRAREHARSSIASNRFRQTYHAIRPAPMAPIGMATGHDPVTPAAAANTRMPESAPVASATPLLTNEALDAPVSVIVDTGIVKSRGILRELGSIP
jgi:hypothetical protein